MSRPFQTSFGADPPLSSAAAASSHPVSYQANVNRQKTKKWAEARPVDYGGDDWGDDYDDDYEPTTPSTTAKPTGLRMPGQALQTNPLSPQEGNKKQYGELPPIPTAVQDRSVTSPLRPRENSFDRDDERRACSGSQALPPESVQQAGNVSQLSSPTSTSAPLPSISTTHVKQPSVTGLRKPVQSPSMAGSIQSSQPTPSVESIVAKPVTNEPTSVPPMTGPPARTNTMEEPSSTTSSKYSQDTMGTPYQQDFSSTHGPSPVQSRTSTPQQNVNAVAGARFPPRKSSIGQNSQPDVPELGSLTQDSAPPKPWTEARSTSPASSTRTASSTASKALPFIRPADIYKRHLEEQKEKERLSMESNRPSIDSINRITERSVSPVRKLPGAFDQQELAAATGEEEHGHADAHHDSTKRLHVLEPVQERKSEYGFDNYNTTSLRLPADPSTNTNTSGDEAESRGRNLDTERAGGFSVSPKLPDFNRMSGFGMDMFSATDNPIKSSNTKESSLRTDDSRTTLDDPSDTNLRSQPSLGFTSVVHQAFDAPLRSTDASSRASNSDEVRRTESESTGTTGISPIMSRVASAARPEARNGDLESHDTPPAIQELDEPNSRRTSRHLHDQQSGVANVDDQREELLDKPDFVPGHRRDLSTPSSDNSPAKTPHLAINTASQLSETGHISEASDASSSSVNQEFAPPRRPFADRERSFRPNLPGGWDNASSNAANEGMASRRPFAEREQGFRPSPAAGLDHASSFSVDNGLAPPQRPFADREQSFRPNLPGGWVSYATTASARTGGSEDATGSEQSTGSQLAHLGDRDDASSTPTAHQAPSQTRDDVARSERTRTEADVEEHDQDRLLDESRPLTPRAHHAAGSLETPDAELAPTGNPYAHTALDPRLGPGRVSVGQNAAFETQHAQQRQVASTASSVAPTPLPKDTPRATRGEDQDYFPRPIAPLKQLPYGTGIDTSASTSVVRPQMLPTLSTQTSPQDQESDRLRKEIIRSLSPREEVSHSSTSYNEVATGTRESTHLPSEYDNYWASADESEVPVASSLPDQVLDQGTEPVDRESESAEPSRLDQPIKVHDPGTTEEPLVSKIQPTPPIPPLSVKRNASPLTASRPQVMTNRFSWEASSEQVPLQSRTELFDPSERVIRQGPYLGTPDTQAGDVERNRSAYPDEDQTLGPEQRDQVDSYFPADATLTTERSAATRLSELEADERPSEPEKSEADRIEPTNPEAHELYSHEASATVPGEFVPGESMADNPIGDDVPYIQKEEEETPIEQRPTLAESKSPTNVSAYGVATTPPDDNHPAKQGTTASLPAENSSVARVDTNIEPPRVAHGQSQTDIADISRITPFKDILAMNSAERRIHAYNESRQQFSNMDTGLSAWLLALTRQHGNSSDVSGGTTSNPASIKSRHAKGNVASPPIQQPYYQQYLNASSPTSSTPPASRTPGSQPIGQQGFNQGGSVGKDLLAGAGKLGGKASKAGKGFFSKGKNKLRGSGAGDKDSPEPKASPANSNVRRASWGFPIGMRSRAHSESTINDQQTSQSGQQAPQLDSSMVPISVSPFDEREFFPVSTTPGTRSSISIPLQHSRLSEVLQPDPDDDGKSNHIDHVDDALDVAGASRHHHDESRLDGWNGADLRDVTESRDVADVLTKPAPISKTQPSWHPHGATPIIEEEGFQYDNAPTTKGSLEVPGAGSTLATPRISDVSRSDMSSTSNAFFDAPDAPEGPSNEGDWVMVSKADAFAPVGGPSLPTVQEGEVVDLVRDNMGTISEDQPHHAAVEYERREYGPQNAGSTDFVMPEQAGPEGHSSVDIQNERHVRSGKLDIDESMAETRHARVDEPEPFHNQNQQPGRHSLVASQDIPNTDSRPRDYEMQMHTPGTRVDQTPYPDRVEEPHDNEKGPNHNVVLEEEQRQPDVLSQQDRAMSGRPAGFSNQPGVHDLARQSQPYSAGTRETSVQKAPAHVEADSARAIQKCVPSYDEEVSQSFVGLPPIRRSSTFGVGFGNRRPEERYVPEDDEDEVSGPESDPVLPGQGETGKLAEAIAVASQAVDNATGARTTPDDFSRLQTHQGVPDPFPTEPLSRASVAGTDTSADQRSSQGFDGVTHKVSEVDNAANDRQYSRTSQMNNSAKPQTPSQQAYPRRPSSESQRLRSGSGSSQQDSDAAVSHFNGRPLSYQRMSSSRLYDQPPSSAQRYPELFRAEHIDHDRTPDGEEMPSEYFQPALSTEEAFLPRRHKNEYELSGLGPPASAPNVPTVENRSRRSSGSFFKDIGQRVKRATSRERSGSRAREELDTQRRPLASRDGESFEPSIGSQDNQDRSKRRSGIFNNLARSSTGSNAMTPQATPPQSRDGIVSQPIKTRTDLVAPPQSSPLARPDNRQLFFGKASNNNSTPNMSLPEPNRLERASTGDLLSEKPNKKKRFSGLTSIFARQSPEKPNRDHVVENVMGPPVHRLQAYHQADQQSTPADTWTGSMTRRQPPPYDKGMDIPSQLPKQHIQRSSEPPMMTSGRGRSQSESSSQSFGQRLNEDPEKDIMVVEPASNRVAHKSNMPAYQEKLDEISAMQHVENQSRSSRIGPSLIPPNTRFVEVGPLKQQPVFPNSQAPNRKPQGTPWRAEVSHLDAEPRSHESAALEEKALDAGGQSREPTRTEGHDSERATAEPSTNGRSDVFPRNMNGTQEQLPKQHVVSSEERQGNRSHLPSQHLKSHQPEFDHSTTSKSNDQQRQPILQSNPDQYQSAYQATSRSYRAVSGPEIGSQQRDASRQTSKPDIAAPRRQSESIVQQPQQQRFSQPVTSQVAPQQQQELQRTSEPVASGRRNFLQRLTQGKTSEKRDASKAQNGVQRQQQQPQQPTQQPQSQHQHMQASPQPNYQAHQPTRQEFVTGMEGRSNGLQYSQPQEPQRQYQTQPAGPGPQASSFALQQRSQQVFLQNRTVEQQQQLQQQQQPQQYQEFQQAWAMQQSQPSQGQPGQEHSQRSTTPHGNTQPNGMYQQSQSGQQRATSQQRSVFDRLTPSKSNDFVLPDNRNHARRKSGGGILGGLLSRKSSDQNQKARDDPMYTQGDITTEAILPPPSQRQRQVNGSSSRPRHASDQMSQGTQKSNTSFGSQATPMQQPPSRQQGPQSRPSYTTRVSDNKQQPQERGRTLHQEPSYAPTPIPGAYGYVRGEGAYLAPGAIDFQLGQQPYPHQHDRQMDAQMRQDSYGQRQPEDASMHLARPAQPSQHHSQSFQHETSGTREDSSRSLAPNLTIQPRPNNITLHQPVPASHVSHSRSPSRPLSSEEIIARSPARRQFGQQAPYQLTLPDDLADAAALRDKALPTDRDLPTERPLPPGGKFHIDKELPTERALPTERQLPNTSQLNANVADYGNSHRHGSPASYPLPESTFSPVNPLMGSVPLPPAPQWADIGYAANTPSNGLDRSNTIHTTASEISQMSTAPHDAAVSRVQEEPRFRQRIIENQQLASSRVNRLLGSTTEHDRSAESAGSVVSLPPEASKNDALRGGSLAQQPSETEEEDDIYGASPPASIDNPSTPQQHAVAPTAPQSAKPLPTKEITSPAPDDTSNTLSASATTSHGTSTALPAEQQTSLQEQRPPQSTHQKMVEQHSQFEQPSEGQRSTLEEHARPSVHQEVPREVDHATMTDHTQPYAVNASDSIVSPQERPSRPSMEEKIWLGNEQVAGGRHVEDPDSRHFAVELDADPEPVMSATSYPGMEWNPYEMGMVEDYVD